MASPAGGGSRAGLAAGQVWKKDKVHTQGARHLVPREDRVSPVHHRRLAGSIVFLWILVACLILIAVLVLFRFALQRDEAAEIVPKIDSMRRASPC